MTSPTEQGGPARWNPADPEPSWLAGGRRPEGVDDDTVAAVGKLSEAMEWLERARGRLYDFHQMMGRADLLAGEAVELLRECGHAGRPPPRAPPTGGRLSVVGFSRPRRGATPGAARRT